MKKVLTLLATILVSAIAANAQLTFPGKANQHTILGGENGKNFAAIFATNCSSRQEAMSKTVDFLVKYDLVQDKASALSKVKEYDDTQSEFEVPVSFRFGWHGTAPVMGAVASLAPVILKADLLFQFFDEGKVRLIIKNFEDYAFYDYAGVDKSKLGKMKPQTCLSESDYQEWYSFYITPTMQDGMGKGIMKFLVYANKGADQIDDFFKQLDDIYHDLDRQVELARKLVDADYYKFGSATDVVATYRALLEQEQLTMPAMTVDNIEKEIAEEKLVFVYDLFWRRDIKKQFDIVFSVVNQYLEGTIEGVAEDGEVTWQLQGDKLLPVDEKLKKKLVKAGQDYFSYYGLQ